MFINHFLLGTMLNNLHELFCLLLTIELLSRYYNPQVIIKETEA